MTTQHVAAFFRRRWLGRAAPRAGARAFACRVEVLEERFLLAQQATNAIPWNIAQSQAAQFQPWSKDDDRTTLSAIEVFAGPGVTSLFNPGKATGLPADSSAALSGAVQPYGLPAIYQVPLDPNDRSMLIAFSWKNPADRIAGSLVLLNSSGQVVWSHKLPGKAFAVDLEFSHISAAPGSALYLEILPAASGSAASARHASEYNLQVMRFTEPMGFRQTVGSGWGRPVEILGYGPGPNQSQAAPSRPTPMPTPTPTPTPVSAPDKPSGVGLPLPEATSAPVGGIFSLNGPNAASGVTVTAVADPDLLLRSGSPRGDARSLLTSPPYRGGGNPADPFCAAPENEANRPAPLHGLGAWAVEQILGPEGQTESEPARGEEAPHLTLTLPPAGIHVLDHVLEESAGLGAGDRAPLPHLDDAEAREFVAAATNGEIGAAVEPSRDRRSRALLPVLYGTTCAILGLSAPDLSASLRRAARRRGEPGSAGDAEGA